MTVQCGNLVPHIVYFLYIVFYTLHFAMFFPYNTDAPIYYRPIVTVSMIVVNTVVFVMQVGDQEITNAYALAVGDGLHPVQWVTNNFLHGGIMHLLGNMISLWAFGLIVEGKLGPWKTILVYLGIGTLYGFTVQLLLLEHEPTMCLGASAIVFGIMAICLIWAPENKMKCFLFIRFRPFFFTVGVKWLVPIFLTLQILVLSLNGGELSSELLHIVGATIGFAIGIILLTTGQVDCGQWDIFSVWAGRHLMTDIDWAKAYAESPEGKREAGTKELHREKKVGRPLGRILEEIRFALQEKNPLRAFHVVKRFSSTNPNWMLPEPELFQLIQLLSEKMHYSEAIEAIQLYLARYETRKIQVQMKLAQAYLRRNQPRTALKALKQLDPKTLDATQRKYYQNLQTKLESMQTQDTCELAEDV